MLHPLAKIIQKFYRLHRKLSYNRNSVRGPRPALGDGHARNVEKHEQLNFGDEGGGGGRAVKKAWGGAARTNVSGNAEDHNIIMISKALYYHDHVYKTARSGTELIFNFIRLYKTKFNVGDF